MANLYRALNCRYLLNRKTTKTPQGTGVFLIAHLWPLRGLFFIEPVVCLT
jgi:hypothetical protein